MLVVAEFGVMQGKKCAAKCAVNFSVPATECRLQDRKQKLVCLRTIR